jgi:CDP-diacylglycerol---glycerol-3-phosphate 3-phosphatidyltransferase
MIDGRRGQARARASDEGQAVEQPAAKRGPQLGLRLHRLGVKADHITTLGLVLAAGTAVIIGMRWLLLGVALIIVGGLMDALDGAVAKAAGSASKRGAFFDSTSDRVADGLIFGGVAWYLAAGKHPELALLPFAIFGAGTVISYERAKAESLGYSGKGGLMERAERLILLGVALTFYWVMIPLLWLLLALTAGTAAWRFMKVWAQATAEMKGEPVATPVVARWRTGRVESRWRAWREGALGGTPGADRRARTPASRWRSRRQAEPLASRVRRVLVPERVGTKAGRSRTPSSRKRSSGGTRRRYSDGA